jgi:protein-S-isoprenylcysteine O-methyltransferase Ste14
MTPTNFLQRGGLWVAAQGVLLLVVVASSLLWHHQWANTATTLMAWGFLAIAAVCGISGTLALGRNLTPFPQPSDQSGLVQHGIYAFIRHPLYSAVIAGILAWALFRASWPALGAGLAAVVFLDAKARREERWLRERFAEYAEYERRVRRFVPWIY